MRNTGDSEDGKGEGERVVSQEVVQARHIELCDARVGQKETESGGRGRERESYHHRPACGKVFDEPPGKSGQRANEQHSPRAELAVENAAGEQSRHATRRDREAAEPRRRKHVHLAQPTPSVVERLPVPACPQDERTSDNPSQERGGKDNNGDGEAGQATSPCESDLAFFGGAV